MFPFTYFYVNFGILHKDTKKSWMEMQRCAKILKICFIVNKVPFEIQSPLLRPGNPFNL